MKLFCALIMLFLPALTYPQDAVRTPAPIVFFDIAGPNSEVLRTFYAELFAWDIAQDGSISTTVVSPSFPGTLRQDPPETLFYIGVADITATLSEIVENGGTIDFPRLEVPGVVVIGMFKDPAGNRVGLVEMENGTAKIP